MAVLRIAFTDWASGTHIIQNRIMRLLSAQRGVIQSKPSEADLLIYSDFGEQHWHFKGLKVYITGENMIPDFDQCDISYSPFQIPGDARAVRLPYYALIMPDTGSLVRPADYNAQNNLSRPEFACFVASNARGSERNQFFRKLHRRKPLVSAGRHFNTTGKAIEDKMSFLHNFRFNLAFENSSSPGYVTEKLIEPLLAGCIPIYWGAPDVAQDFNLDCMINVAGFSSDDEAIDHILGVDTDPAARLKLLSAPVFHGNRPPKYISDEYLLAPLLKLIDSGIKPGARRYRHRKLREHAFSSPLQQRITSMRCRLDGILWKLGVR